MGVRNERKGGKGGDGMGWDGLALRSESCVVWYTGLWARIVELRTVWFTGLLVC